jgi:hypothetical protein
MSDNALNGRAVFVPGTDPIEAVADALVRSNAGLFNREGRFVVIRDGALVSISGIGLPDFIAQHVVVPRLHNSGDDDNPKWAVAYEPLHIQGNNLALGALVSALERLVPSATGSAVIDLRRWRAA